MIFKKNKKKKKNR